MKSKFFKKTKEEKKEEDLELENELEQDEEEEDEIDDLDIQKGGPTISSAKKNKITLIVGLAFFVTIIIYIFFSGDSEKQVPQIEPVLPKPVLPASPNELSGVDLPFDPLSKTDDSLDEPKTPETPPIPDVPEGITLPAPITAPPIDILESPPVVEDPANAADENVDSVKKDAVDTTAKPIETTKAKPELDPRYAPIVVFSGGQETLNNVPAVGYDENIVNLKEDDIASLERTPVSVKTTYIDDRVHAINQGKLLTAVLETAINTEIPGLVRAIISRDVYGESGNKVLIPRGSRLYGSYSTQIVRGQGRVNISWTRLIRSDGVDLSISFQAADQFGRAGIPGNIDNKYGSVITNSLLTSVLAVGGVAAAQKLLGNNANTTATTSAGVTTTTGNASAQAVADVTSTIVNTVETIIGNTLNVNPVITVPQGTKITVVVNGDMRLPEMTQ